MKQTKSLKTLAHWVLFSAVIIFSPASIMQEFRYFR